MLFRVFLSEDKMQYWTRVKSISNMDLINITMRPFLFIFRFFYLTTDIINQYFISSFEIF